ncbi:hypothetical protein ANCCAN_22335 [Ancylostoma caninum]|uniref:Uncharacterized protein n=1 Tax=Ancylostoma caninum TaxID=29170 RepID=A0A368FI24_ANCCA|nr:hypothetical protein ANCCAN_22335 [Ancylostoma caninum]
MGCFLVNLYSLMETIQLSIDRGHTLELNHFTPQTWYCNFREKLQDYIIIRYEEHENRTKKFGDDLSMVFQKAGVPEYVREEIQHEVKGKSVSADVFQIFYQQNTGNISPTRIGVLT